MSENNKLSLSHVIICGSGIDVRSHKSLRKSVVRKNNQGVGVIAAYKSL